MELVDTDIVTNNIKVYHFRCTKVGDKARDCIPNLNLDRWPLAGDQLYIDMDLSTENLPAGTQLALGSAIIEVTLPPHTGCKKFVDRFGLEVMKFVNSSIGKQLNLRGINAKVVQAGTIKCGDILKKLPAEL